MKLEGEAVSSLNQRVNDLTDLLEKLKEGDLRRITTVELATLTVIVRSQRNMLAKRAVFYHASALKRAHLRVKYGPFTGTGYAKALRLLEEDR